jgi:hypothetical protein
MIDCGTCTGNLICGGAGTPNVCGCSLTTCVAQLKNCGTIGDGCGGTLNCGTCPNDEVCGAFTFGSQNRCFVRGYRVDLVHKSYVLTYYDRLWAGPGTQPCLTDYSAETSCGTQTPIGGTSLGYCHPGGSNPTVLVYSSASCR